MRSRLELDARKSTIVCSLLIPTLLFISTISAPAQTLLPQDHDYQITLRNWMATLTEADFDVTLQEMSWSSAAYSTVDELYKQWIVLRKFDTIGFQAYTRPMRAASKHFVLDNGAGEGIEGSGVVMIFRNPAFAAFWAQFGVDGNPHFDSRALKLRAAVMAAVDMMMLDHYHDTQGARRSDFLGGSMRPWVYIYTKTKDELPVDVQQAFLDGFLRMIGKMEDWGPTDVNTNMDTRAIATAAYLYRATDDQSIKDRCVNLAKNVLFGSLSGTPENSDADLGIFHSAGYVGEEDGPETTYNGISLYYILEAAMITRGEPEWDAFLPEVVRRMVNFKAYQAFPDPDGYYDGPSNYAKRTADSYVYDQHGHYWRDIASGLVTDEGKYLVPGVKGRNDQGVFSESEMVSQINNAIKTLNKNGRFVEADTTGPVVWDENHWPEDWPYTWDHYVDGSYDILDALNLANDPLMLPPFARDADFNKSFDNEFWAFKGSDGSREFGWFIESVPDAGKGYKEGYLGGGSLCEFWTDATGTVIRGKLRGKPADVPDSWKNYETWATHHIWGVGDGGNPFSTARNRQNSVTYDIDGEFAIVTVSGVPETPTSSPGITGKVNYTRVFEKAKNGLIITSMLTSDGSDMVTELWDSLPIFLRDGMKQSDDATIDFRVAGTWQEATTELVTADAIRIGRFGAFAYVVFEQPQNVKLSTEVWTTDYQTDNRIRSVHIDMLGSGGTAVPLPTSTSITYALTTTEAGVVTSVEAKDDQVPAEFQLSQNYPNPFNPSTTIRFSLPRREHVTLRVFDVLGREVATLLDDELSSGEHSVVFNSKNLSSGVYFYRLTAGQFTQIRKGILMK